MDIIIKLIVKTNMNLYEKIVIIRNFFKIEYVLNDGAAFSSFSNMTIFLVITSILVLIFLINYLKNNNLDNKLETISFGIIIGGITGNLIDRIIYKKVIDYLSFKIFGYDFAIFNFADIGIVVGILLLLIYYIGVEINGSKRRTKN